MKLTNMKITPKLGILVGVTLLGLCVAGALAGYLMQREMLNARIDQTKSIVDMALNMAAGLKKQVDAGQMTKEAAIAEFGKRADDEIMRVFHFFRGDRQADAERAKQPIHASSPYSAPTLGNSTYSGRRRYP